MEPFISLERSIIPAVDMHPSKYSMLLEGLSGVEGVVSIKVGFRIGLSTTLRAAVVMAKVHLSHGSKVIYDHQKAGTDVPDTAEPFADVMAEAGVDGAIIFPQSGPATQESWTRALQDRGIRVIVGSEMTHPRYLAKDGGYIRDDAPLEMFDNAIAAGVVDFVVPGNKVESVEKYRRHFDEKLGEGNYALYAPGFINQGGDLSETGKVAGKRISGIVGRALTDKETADAVREVALSLTSQIAD